jgi:serine protease Do
MPGYQAPGTDVTRYGERENTSYDSYQFSQQPAAGGSGKPPKKKSDVWKKIGIGAAIAGVCALVAALVFLGVSLLGNKITGSSSHGTSSTATTSKPETGSTGQNKTPGSTESKADESKGTTSSSDTGTAVTNTSGDMSIEQVAADAMPSMVAITTKTVQQVQSYITGQTQEYQATAEGSGIIVGKTDSELLIATNNHVITGSETISVAFVDNSVASGEIKGANSDEDLAVVAVKLSDLSSDTQSKVSVIDIGSSDDCKVGESVVAIGNALGYGQSVSSGIVSALNRTVTVDNVKHTLIQTDAAINPGNSGGALLNMKGELIGINEVKYADTTVEGMGYAIPISTAEPILNKLMNKSDRQKVDDANASYLGVSVVTMPTTYVQQGYPAGAYVSAVVSGQAADKAGIQEGDIITAIDGYSVTSADELVGELTYYAQGTTIDFSVSRLNSSQTAFETQTISVTLGSKADAPAAGSTNSSSSADSSTSGTGNGQTPFGSSQGGTIQPGNGQTGGTTQPGNGLQGS